MCTAEVSMPGFFISPSYGTTSSPVVLWREKPKGRLANQLCLVCTFRHACLLPWALPSSRLTAPRVLPNRNLSLETSKSDMLLQKSSRTKLPGPFLFWLPGRWGPGIPHTKDPERSGIQNLQRVRRPSHPPQSTCPTQSKRLI